MRPARATLLLVGGVLAGCQDNVATPFPPGLEPLEDNPVALDGTFVEHLESLSIDGSLVRVLSWYDNEWGFSNRMSDTAVAIGKLG